MKKLSANSKLGQHYVRAYETSTRYTLKDVYVKPSAEKQAAFKYCCKKCEAEDGYQLKVIGACCQSFTVAFLVKNSFGATELRVITRCHDYLVYFGSKL